MMMFLPCMKSTVSKDSLNTLSFTLLFLVKGFTEEEFEESENSTTTEDIDNADYRTGQETPDQNDYDYAADEAGDYDLGDKRSTSSSTTSTVAPSYEGDYEEVDDHLKKSKGKIADDDIDICHQVFDSMAVIRNELFVFLQQKMWRYSYRGVLRLLIC